MNWKRSVLAFGLVCLGCTAVSQGQSTKSDRDMVAQVRARADKGDAKAQLELGMMYETGTVLERDFKKAAKWHRKAAEQELAEGEYQLARDYADGLGVKPDAMEALRWYRKAAAQGFVDAQIELGRAYANGRGVRPSAVEAVRWFRNAADQGSAAGKYELGRSYLEGEGVTKDTDEGLKWLRPAAEQGYALAQYRLGQCYEQGEGVTKDLVEAYKWFNLAAAHDEDNAADIRLSLAKVATVLTEEQVAEAQRLTREFKASEPATPAPAGNTNQGTGSVHVQADDSRNEVFVDGAFVGNPPATLKLAPGRHVVEVKRAGYKTYQREIQVTAGAELNLKAELERK